MPGCGPGGASCTRGALGLLPVAGPSSCGRRSCWRWPAADEGVGAAPALGGGLSRERRRGPLWWRRGQRARGGGRRTRGAACPGCLLCAARQATRRRDTGETARRAPLAGASRAVLCLGAEPASPDSCDAAAAGGRPSSRAACERFCFQHHSAPLVCCPSASPAVTPAPPALTRHSGCWSRPLRYPSHSSPLPHGTRPARHGRDCAARTTGGGKAEQCRRAGGQALVGAGAGGVTPPSLLKSLLSTASWHPARVHRRRRASSCPSRGPWAHPRGPRGADTRAAPSRPRPSL